MSSENLEYDFGGCNTSFSTLSISPAATNSRYASKSKRRHRITASAVAILGSVFCLGLANAQTASIVNVADFGPNPGNLKMYKYIPNNLSGPAPLVVVMHGCTQNARSFATDTGWIAVADRLGVALLMPDAENHAPQKCFNWFDNPGRDKGDALSIKNMIEKMRTDHSIDTSRIYATGLSAGGAMTSVMLAVYPEVFAGGGVVAGLPYGCAHDQISALMCMFMGCPLPGGPTVGSVLGESWTRDWRARTAVTREPSPSGLSIEQAQAPELPLSPAYNFFLPTPIPDMCHRDWGGLLPNTNAVRPKISIWHGTSDATVVPANEEHIKLQWLGAHHIDPNSGETGYVNGYPHTVFRNTNGVSVVETYSITGMSHAQPIDLSSGCGSVEQYIMDKHICASSKIAQFWGLDSGRVLGARD